MVLLDVSVFAGVDAMALVVASFVFLVGVLDAVVVSVVIGVEVVAFELVVVMLVVALLVAVIAGIGAELVLLVSFVFALLVRIVVASEGNTRVKVVLVPELQILKIFC